MGRLERFFIWLFNIQPICECCAYPFYPGDEEWHGWGNCVPMTEAMWYDCYTGALGR